MIGTGTASDLSLSYLEKTHMRSPSPEKITMLCLEIFLYQIIASENSKATRMYIEPVPHAALSFAVAALV